MKTIAAVLLKHSTAAFSLKFVSRRGMLVANSRPATP